MDFVVGCLEILSELFKEEALSVDGNSASISGTVNFFELFDFVDSIEIKTGLAEAVFMFTVAQTDRTPLELFAANLAD